MKVLLADLETAPIIADVWRLWDNNVALNQIVSDWYILSYSAKWLGKKGIQYRDQRGVENIEDDTELLKEFWKLLDEADIVVAHNGDRFDIPKINARFIRAGLPPPSPYRTVDTLKIAKARFKFTSNRLAYLAEYLNVPVKKRTHHKYPGHQLWIEVRKQNLAAWREMQLYNQDDVHALEGVYLKLRAWDQRAPNAGAYNTDGVPACRVCGGTHLEKRGFQTTAAGKYQRYVCLDCNAWGRDKINLLTKEQRRALTVT